MFYLVEILKYNDGTKDSYSIYSYETEKEATSRFHSEIGGWMKKENIESILCMVINEAGGIIKNEYVK